MKNGFASMSPADFGTSLQIILAAGLNALSMSEDDEASAFDCLPYDPDGLTEGQEAALDLVRQEDPDTLLRMLRMYDELMSGVTDAHDKSQANKVMSVLCRCCGDCDDCAELDEDEPGIGGSGFGFAESVEENRRFFVNGSVKEVCIVGAIEDPQVSVHLQDTDGNDLFARFELTETCYEPDEGGEDVIRKLL